MSRVLVLSGLAALAVACSNPSGQEQQQDAPVPAALRTFVLDDVPSDVPNRTFVDFGGKVHLVGWDVQPEGVVAPGSKLTLTMYWRSAARLDSGWALFTHLTGNGGKRIGNVDDVGPLRGANGLSPSSWQPGKVYVDSQTFEIPRGIRDSEITIVVGVWKGNARLDVLSGRVDRERRAIVAHVKTGLARPSAPARATQPQSPHPGG
jgi:hypothetical protein